MVKKSIFICIFLATLCLSTNASVLAASALELEYTVSIIEPATHEAHMQMRISGPLGNFFILKASAFRGLFISPQNLAANDMDGNQLEIIEIAGNDSTWQIKTNGSTEILVAYDVCPSCMDSSYRLHGYIGDEYAMAEGQTLFLVPNYSGEQSMRPSQTIDSIVVNFNLPDDWQAYAPWRREGDNFYPGLNDGLYLESLCFSPIAMGGFDLYSQNIQGTELMIGTYSGWSEEDISMIIEGAPRLFEYQKSVFSGEEEDQILILFSPALNDGSQPQTGEWTTGHTVVYENSVNPINWMGFSHGIFHRWNAWQPFGLHGSHVWMVEGFAVFYEKKSVAQTGLTATLPENITGDFWFWKIDGHEAEETDSNGVECVVSKDNKSITYHIPLALIGNPDSLTIGVDNRHTDGLAVEDSIDKHLFIRDTREEISMFIDDQPEPKFEDIDPKADFKKVEAQILDGYLVVEVTFADRVSSEYRYDLYMSPGEQNKKGYHIGFSPLPVRLFPELYNQLENDIDFYQSILAGNMTDSPLASADQEHIIYFKSSVVILEMAKELLDRTEGEVTIDDVMHRMYQDCYYGNKTCSTDYINHILNELSGSDFNNFFTDYVYGTKEINFDWVFEDPDEDNIISGIEVYYDTDRFAKDSDMDGYTDDLEIIYGGDPLNFDQQPRPTPTPSPTPTSLPPTSTPTASKTDGSVVPTATLSGDQHIVDSSDTEQKILPLFKIILYIGIGVFVFMIALPAGILIINRKTRKK